jgi:hypothetical protein
MNGTFPQSDVHNTGEWTPQSLNKINNEKYLTPTIDSSLERRGLQWRSYRQLNKL